MAEFCEECFIRIHHPDPNAFIELSDEDELDLCEGCGLLKRFVVSIGSIPEADDELRYRKKRSRTVKKSNHKHQYENCVFGYNNLRLDKAHGFVWDDKEFSVGTYCPICGKIGSTIDSEWTTGLYWRSKQEYWKPEALREFDEKTRSLPYFWLDDRWQKSVALFE